jgi:hypothetical protein
LGPLRDGESVHVLEHTESLPSQSSIKFTSLVGSTGDEAE